MTEGGAGKGGSARRAAEGPVAARRGPALPEEGLERALVLVERAAERALAQLAELLGGAAVLGLGVAARVALLNELAQGLGQVHLRGLLQLHRDEVRHGRRAGGGAGGGGGGEARGGGQPPPPSPQLRAPSPLRAAPARRPSTSRFRDCRALPTRRRHARCPRPLASSRAAVAALGEAPSRA